MTEPAQIAKSLSQIEKDWFLAKTWGSWLWDVGQDLAAKGLVEINELNMQLTPLGLAVRATLEKETP